jgi:hypothetical protein
MKSVIACRFIRVLFFGLFLVLCCFVSNSYASENKINPPGHKVESDDLLHYDSSKAAPIHSQKTTIKLERLPLVETSSAGTLHLRSGTSSYENFRLDNKYYQFEYPKNTQAVFVALGWEYMPFKFLGQWGGRLDVGYAFAKTSVNLQAQGLKNLRLHRIPLSLSLTYLADYHRAMKWFMPAFTAGSTYSFYIQTGDTDGSQTQGGSLALNWSAGVRHSLDWTGLKAVALTIDYILTTSLSGSEANFSGSTLAAGIATRF